MDGSTCGYGSRPSSRSTASILSTVGLPEWIASSAEGYVRLATEYARDEARLVGLRKLLREEATPVAAHGRGATRARPGGDLPADVVQLVRWRCGAKLPDLSARFVLHIVGDFTHSAAGPGKTQGIRLALWGDVSCHRVTEAGNVPLSSIEQLR